MPFLAPIIAAISAFAAAHAIIFGIIASTVLTAASTAIGSLLRKKPSLPTITHDAQTRQLTIRQPVAPWAIVYGRSRIGGVIVYVTLTGASSEYLQMVIVHCSGEIEDIPKMYFDGIEVPVDGSGDATGTFAGHVHWEKVLGTDSQTAYAGLISETAGLGDAAWTSNHKGNGHAHSWVRLKWDADLFPNGLPHITWDIKGRKVTKYRSSPVVDEYSENPIECIEDFLTNQRYGMKADVSELNADVNDAEANSCDELIPLNTSPVTLEPRYTCNGSFSTSSTPQEIISGLLTAMAGRAVWSGGMWALYSAIWRAPNPDHALDDNAVRAPGLVVTARVARDQIFNGVKGLYISPENNWQSSDFPPYYLSSTRGYASDPYLIEDGERIWRDIELPYTISASMAQRLAKIELERCRRQKVLSMPAKLVAYRAQVCEVIQFSHPRFGWTDKTFEVAEVKFSIYEENKAPALGVDLSLRETDANVYGWSTDDELQANSSVVPPPPGTLPNSVPQNALPPVNAANRNSSLIGGSPLTASDAGSSATIDIAAFVMQFGFGTVAYNSGTITGLDYSTTYWIYADDPYYSGGSVTYFATLSFEDVVSGSSRVFVDVITTPAAAAGDTGGGGIGGGCPVPEMVVADGRACRTIEGGDSIHSAREDGTLETSGVMSARLKAIIPCFEIDAGDGFIWRGSWDTPFTLPDGRRVKAIHMHGGQVSCRRGIAAGREWRKCTVRSIGKYDVMAIDLGGKTFPSGVTADRLIDSHNKFLEE